MSPILRDLAYAFRKLRRAPGFAITAVLTLALGIGASSAIFTLVDQVSLRLLPVQDPQELVMLRWEGSWWGSNTGYASWSYPWYRDLRDQSGEVFEDLFGRFNLSMAVAADGEAEQSDVVLVTGNYFSALGVRPAHGRLLAPSDDETPGAHSVAVISHDYWRDRFGRAPDVLGRTLRINQHPFEIVGVSQPGFRGIDLANRPDVFIPAQMKDAVSTGFHKTIYQLDNRRSRWLNIFGRLRDGVGIEQARAALEPIHKAGIEYDLTQSALSGMDDFARNRYREAQLLVDPGGQGPRRMRERLDAPLAMLMAMVGVLLLIACGNVANLLMARAAARTKEIAVRFAVGAKRAQVVRELLFESAILAFTAGALGLAFADTLASFLVSLAPEGAESFNFTTASDWRVISFAIAAAALTTFLFGLAPALRATRIQLAPTLKDASASIAGAADPWRKALAASQVFFSLLLLIAAGLFQQTLAKLRSIDIGLNSEQTLVFTVDPLQGGYDDAAADRLLARLETELEARPEIVSAGYASVRILADDDWNNTVQVEGYERSQGESTNPHYNAVSPGYFETLEIPILQGRAFRPSDIDGAPRVGLVNESFVERYFAGDSPLGRKFGFGDPNIEIVGVVPDIRYRDLRTEIPEQVFVPFAQAPWPTAGQVYVRTRLSPADAALSVRAVVREIDASLPVVSLLPMEEQIESTLTVERLLAYLATAFGAAASLLAAIGLYGLLAYSVARRRREIGLRMALGAERSDVAKLVLRETARLFAAGAIPALPAAFLLSRFVEAQLYGVEPTDPWNALAATALLALTALAAAALPAWRAARTEPMAALRFE